MWWWWDIGKEIVVSLRITYNCTSNSADDGNDETIENFGGIEQI